MGHPIRTCLICWTFYGPSIVLHKTPGICVNLLLCQMQGFIKTRSKTMQLNG